MGLKKLFAPVDMTEGTPWGQILTFAVPLLIGNLVQQLYNTVDSIVVGRFVGDDALAAVGSVGSFMNLLIVLFVGISIGSSVMVSQYLGAKKPEELAGTIGNSMLLTAAATVIVTVVGVIISRPVMELLNTPDSIIDMAVSYLTIAFLGTVGQAFYNNLNGILRGLGDSVSALFYLVIASVLNIFGDLVTVIVFHMGVEGVALATVTAQGISALLCFLKLLKMQNSFKLKLSDFRFNKVYSGGIIRLGVPSGITQAIFSMAMLIIQPISNSFGADYIAANTIVMRVDGFVMMPTFSFSTALTTFAGQNVGAAKLDRVRGGTKQGLCMAVGTSIVITILILIFGKYIMGIFTTTDSLVALAMNLMRILAVGYIFFAVTQCLTGIMRGCGDATTPMWISIFTTVIVRLPLVYALIYLTKSAENPNGNIYCLMASTLIVWVLGALISIWVFKKGGWRKKIPVGGEK